MDAVEFLKARKRLCRFVGHCNICPLYMGSGVCSFKIVNESDECAIVSAVEQWAKDHPVKTRQSEFLKMFPEAALMDGVLCICPMHIKGNYNCKNKVGVLCSKCRRDYWLQETTSGMTL